MGRIRFTGTRENGYTAAEMGVAGQPECHVKHVGGGWAATYTVPPPSGSGMCGTTQVHGIYRSRAVAAGYGIAAHKAAWPGRFNTEVTARIILPGAGS
jgi:hypothetical protein